MGIRFEFLQFPTLNTNRLVLREVTERDAADVFELRGDYQVTKLNFGVNYKSLDEAHFTIQRMREGFDVAQHLRFGITLGTDDKVIGLVGFNYFSHADHRAAVGFDLQRRFWGRGIMPEALTAVLDFGFNQIGLNRIEADCSIMNLASQRVLQKVGFVYEGRQRDQYYYDGTYFDLLLWSILKREWAAR
ncbi:MAG: GNAT family N-acetyltransferase [Chloroflexi bacterium]|nr:GNAT family N-acetyltransferase [Chloroflexota bacterium]